MLPQNLLKRTNRKEWRNSLTFWSHICRKTFCKSACLALIASWYIDHTFSALFACVFQISAEVEVDKTKPLIFWSQWIWFGVNWPKFVLNSSRKKLTVECFVWKIHDNRHMMVHHNAFQMLDHRILCNGCSSHELNSFSFFARTLNLSWNGYLQVFHGSTLEISRPTVFWTKNMLDWFKNTFKN